MPKLLFPTNCIEPLLISTFGVLCNTSIASTPCETILWSTLKTILSTFLSISFFFDTTIISSSSFAFKVIFISPIYMSLDKLIHLPDPKLNYIPMIQSDILKDKCSKLIKDYFKKKRQKI